MTTYTARDARHSPIADALTLEDALALVARALSSPASDLVAMQCSMAPHEGGAMLGTWNVYLRADVDRDDADPVGMISASEDRDALAGFSADEIVVGPGGQTLAQAAKRNDDLR